MNPVPMRSLLFVPGDSEKKLARVDACAADAVILDLEDSVALPGKPRARELVGRFLQERPAASRPIKLWVRINALDSALALADLVAVVGGEPDGIMQPKIDGPADVAQLSAYLDALEAVHRIPTGTIGIIPVATETALAPFRLGDLAASDLPRLAGLTWGAEDLASAISASTNRDGNGEWAFTYKMVRSLTLLAAHAAGVPAYETLHADFRDDAGLRSTSSAARVEGFGGRIAIHPDQVAIINDSFSPSDEELAYARRVVESFSAEGATGTASLDGKMIDIPHLKQAKALLLRAGLGDQTHQ
jgi:citrate lyase subunit beta / citryl-CoA lyase